MDYTRITADAVRGPEIGRLYLEASPFVTSLARVAYAAFEQQVRHQFRELIMPDAFAVRVEFQDDDPYACAEEMFDDVDRHQTLKIYRTQPDQGHPLVPDAVNDMFRAVHDFHGHYMTRRGFDRHGEEAAWVRHSQMFSGLGRRAMTTETRGQSSALCWVTSPEFPPQKAVLLPDWVSEIPSQWVRS